ncbi:hypothetical protein EJ08DRAFT_685178 [Tothia fuscella]|uniref:F-box domain-containing protein n=1 Tax=Tothia fuscella TaxID=1048955 RepID=A0A9P4P1S1_9PEZI|nr:hypothetical protein EJ08DRAFT_685178 [Tothia fuscella]
MNINAFPNEILSAILERAAEANKEEGVTFTFGLVDAGPAPKRNFQRYVKGPVPPSLLKWDATQAIRRVCSRWHEWGVGYAMKDVYIKCWRGSERWADLSLNREKYRLYELVDSPKGWFVYRDPFMSLRSTCKLFTKYPDVATNVRRLWFDGLYVPETDAQILTAVSSCINLTSLSIPWTVLRHGSAEQWADLLGIRRDLPLRSLELLAVNLSSNQLALAEADEDLSPLDSRMVNFSQLKRLKLFGDTNYSLVNDDDLIAISRTATNLEEFQVTCMSTVTIEGVMAVVKASQQTLRLLEHSPRSQDGFMHPDPGHLSDGEHICEILTSCPKLEDLSISVPSMCEKLFSNSNVRWTGDCQVRALSLCGHDDHNDTTESSEAMKRVLDQSRELIAQRAKGYFPAKLTIELFFADLIFDPHLKAVHGDFSLAELVSMGSWPNKKEISRKGPYGSTGLYGKKNEEYLFDRVSEDDFFEGVSRTLLTL